MTTVVLWKSSPLLSLSMKEGGINVVADSRVSDGSSVLTNNCAKIFEVLVHCQQTEDEVTFQNRTSHFDKVIVAIAGSTLIAHNVVFCLQQTLCSLIGRSIPTIDEIATFTSSVLENLSKEVGIIKPNNAYSEVVLVGNKEGETVAISVKPTNTGPLKYNPKYIEEFPYSMGTGSKAFYRAYSERAPLCKSEQSLVQLPLRIFDENLIQGQEDPKTGGEIQMLTLNDEGVSRFIPLRWSEKQSNYVRQLFGQDILNEAIGPARIASATILLDDC